MFIRLLEFVAIVLLGVFIIEQVIVPSYFKRPIFPFFRKEKKLKEQLLYIHQEQYEVELENEITQKRNNLKEKV